MYRKVKKAWVILDANGGNELTVLFDEPQEYDRTETKPGTLFAKEYQTGMVRYGCFDNDGKWWSSRAGAVNSAMAEDQIDKLSAEIVDICEVHLDDDKRSFSRRSAAIILPFANEILKTFNLPFHYERKVDDELYGDICHALYSNPEVWIPAGTGVIAQGEEDEATVKEHMFMSGGCMPNECYRCRIWNNIYGKFVDRYYQYTSLPKELYPGIVWDDFLTDMQQVVPTLDMWWRR